MVDRQMLPRQTKRTEIFSDIGTRIWHESKSKEENGIPRTEQTRLNKAILELLVFVEAGRSETKPSTPRSGADPIRYDPVANGPQMKCASGGSRP